MQPYFFPYLGHFALIGAVDHWIVFDVTQYTPKTWMNRNRILHPSTGWQYVVAPLANSSISIKTSEARVLDLAEAKRSLLGKLAHYRKRAPYFHQVNQLIEQAFADIADDSLVSLNVSALQVVCDYLGIPFSYQICSNLALDYPPDLGPGDWAPYICKMLGASEYVNPEGGRSLFDIDIFNQHGIGLYFAKFESFDYPAAPYDFEPDLSILDVMMWNSPEDIAKGIKAGLKLHKAN